MLAEARERYPVEVLDWNLPFLLGRWEPSWMRHDAPRPAS